MLKKKKKKDWKAVHQRVHKSLRAVLRVISIFFFVFFLDSPPPTQIFTMNRYYFGTRANISLYFFGKKQREVNQSCESSIIINKGPVLNT